MNVFAAAAAAMFNDPNGSEAAVLHVKDQLPLPLRTMRRDSTLEGDVSGIRTLSSSTTFEILRSASPQAPPEGSVIRAGLDGEEAWQVFDVQVNQRKGVWVLSCNQA